MNILLVEDDKRISEFIVRGLQNHNFVVTLAEDGVAARQLMFEGIWDVIIMDIMVPEIDGIQLVKLLRFKGNYTPVLILSALGEVEDITSGLETGADDYLTKPFHFKELIARIYALVRRNHQSYNQSPNVISCNDLILDLDQHTVTLADKPVDLSPREFKLLNYMMQNKNKVVPRTSILNVVWGIDHNNLTNVVDVYISYLRNKIDKDRKNKMIHTVKGVGYSLKEY